MLGLYMTPLAQRNASIVNAWSKLALISFAAPCVLFFSLPLLFQISGLFAYALVLLIPILLIIAAISSLVACIYRRRCLNPRSNVPVVVLAASCIALFLLLRWWFTIGGKSW